MNSNQPQGDGDEFFFVTLLLFLFHGRWGSFETSSSSWAKNNKVKKNEGPKRKHFTKFVYILTKNIYF